MDYLKLQDMKDEVQELQGRIKGLRRARETLEQ